MNIQLSITEQCNLRCSYCYYKESHAKRSAVMSEDVMEATVSLAVQKCVEQKQTDFNITFFGGEPLLRVDFIKKTVKFAKDLIKSHRAELPRDFALTFAVNTNGTLFTDEVVRFLKREKFTVYLSVDGPEKKHNISRKTVDGKGSFRAIKPFIPAMADMNAVVLMVVTRMHVRGLANSVKWMFGQGFKRVSTCVDFDGSWSSEDFDALVVEYEKLARFWYNAKRKGSDIYLGTIQDKVTMCFMGIRQKHYTCYMNPDSLAVAANGNTFPCTRFISSQNGAPYITGNVFDMRSGIYKGVLPRDVRRFMEKDRKECGGCAIRQRCLAHECGCTSFYTTGTLDKVSPEVCTHERILCAICDEYAAKLQRIYGPESVL